MPFCWNFWGTVLLNLCEAVYEVKLLENFFSLVIFLSTYSFPNIKSLLLDTFEGLILISFDYLRKSRLSSFFFEKVCLYLGHCRRTIFNRCFAKILFIHFWKKCATVYKRKSIISIDRDIKNWKKKIFGYFNFPWNQIKIHHNAKIRKNCVKSILCCIPVSADASRNFW